MHVLKLADAGIAALEKFHIKLCSDVPERFRRKTCHKAVHKFAPRPEIVALVVTLASLGQTGKRALEGMRMQIAQAGNDRSIDAFTPVAPVAIGADVDARDAALGLDLAPHVLGPALRQPGVGCEPCEHHGPAPSAQAGSPARTIR